MPFAWGWKKTGVHESLLSSGAAPWGEGKLGVPPSHMPRPKPGHVLCGAQLNLRSQEAGTTTSTWPICGPWEQSGVGGRGTEAGEFEKPADACQ